MLTDKEMTGEIKIPRHVAIIMDGNGRWAEQRGMSRVDFKSGAYQAQMPKCDTESYEEIKAKVIEGRQAGQSYTSLGRKHKVPVSLVKYWVKAAEEKGPELSTKTVEKKEI